jgi:hypothetical protein
LQFWPALSRPRIARNTERVATLFRILQRHYRQFMETLTLQITSRPEFERLAAPNADTLTDPERACRFLCTAAACVRRQGRQPQFRHRER